MTGEEPLSKQIEDGTVTAEGDTGVLDQLKSTLDQFDLGFELLPGTGAADLTPEATPLEQPAPANTSGG
jgi:hypothetical protein